MENVFSGTSINGDIGEAIELAIAAAKEGIPASLVKWELVKIQGENGGFVETNIVTVLIRANA